MRTFTTEHTVYTFDELSEDAKTRAINKYAEDMDFPFMTEDLTEKLIELLENSKITYDEVPTVYYSLSYCQGDGAMFEGTVYWHGYAFKIKQNGHYYHYNSKSIEFERRDEKNIGDDVYNRVYDEFNELYVDICKTLERYGYKYIEDELSEDNISELLSGAEYEFYQNGDIA